mmetsp:Transcript_70036/g.226591  ORF Transcript_70036/g.226591 Transcript_70036/m.226591 type:complete len:1114 (+) Transcript_70036:3-3344(+)
MTGASAHQAGALDRAVHLLLAREEDVRDQLAVQAKTLLRVDRRLMALERREPAPGRSATGKERHSAAPSCQDDDPSGHADGRKEANTGATGNSHSGTVPGLAKDVKEFCEKQFVRLELETRRHVDDLGHTLRQWMDDMERGVQAVWEEHVKRGSAEVQQQAEKLLEDGVAGLDQGDSGPRAKAAEARAGRTAGPGAGPSGEGEVRAEEPEEPRAVLLEPECQGASAPEAAVLRRRELPEASVTELQEMAARVAEQLWAADQEAMPEATAAAASPAAEAAASLLSWPGGQVEATATAPPTCTTAVLSQDMLLLPTGGNTRALSLPQTPDSQDRVLACSAPRYGHRGASSHLRASCYAQVGVQDPNALKPPSPHRSSPPMATSRDRDTAAAALALAAGHGDAGCRNAGARSRMQLQPDSSAQSPSLGMLRDVVVSALCTSPGSACTPEAKEGLHKEAGQEWASTAGDCCMERPEAPLQGIVGPEGSTRTEPSSGKTAAELRAAPAEQDAPVVDLVTLAAVGSTAEAGVVSPQATIKGAEEEGVDVAGRPPVQEHDIGGECCSRSPAATSESGDLVGTVGAVESMTKTLAAGAPDGPVPVVVGGLASIDSDAVSPVMQEQSHEAQLAQQAHSSDQRETQERSQQPQNLDLQAESHGVAQPLSAPILAVDAGDVANQLAGRSPSKMITVAESGHVPDLHVSTHAGDRPALDLWDELLETLPTLGGTASAPLPPEGADDTNSADCEHREAEFKVPDEADAAHRSSKAPLSPSSVCSAKSTGNGAVGACSGNTEEVPSCHEPGGMAMRDFREVGIEEESKGSFVANAAGKPALPSVSTPCSSSSRHDSDGVEGTDSFRASSEPEVMTALAVVPASVASSSQSPHSRCHGKAERTQGEATAAVSVVEPQSVGASSSSSHDLSPCGGGGIKLAEQGSGSNLMGVVRAAEVQADSSGASSLSDGADLKVDRLRGCGSAATGHEGIARPATDRGSDRESQIFPCSHGADAERGADQESAESVQPFVATPASSSCASPHSIGSRAGQGTEVCGAAVRVEEPLTLDSASSSNEGEVDGEKSRGRCSIFVADPSSSLGSCSPQAADGLWSGRSTVCNGLGGTAASD